jgi:hypothetical protein
VTIDKVRGKFKKFEFEIWTGVGVCTVACFTYDNFWCHSFACHFYSLCAVFIPLRPQYFYSLWRFVVGLRSKERVVTLGEKDLIVESGPGSNVRDRVATRVSRIGSMGLPVPRRWRSAQGLGRLATQAWQTFTEWKSWRRLWLRDFRETCSPFQVTNHDYLAWCAIFVTNYDPFSIGGSTDACPYCPGLSWDQVADWGKHSGR